MDSVVRSTGCCPTERAIVLIHILSEPKLAELIQRMPLCVPEIRGNEWKYVRKDLFSSMIRVLYIHTSGVLGGGQRSLLEMIKGFAADRVKAAVVMPRGSATDLFNSEGVDCLPTLGVVQFDNTLFGHYRGI